MNIPTTLLDIQSAIRDGNLTVQELVAYYTSQIHKNKHLNIYVEDFCAEAQILAAKLDKRIQADDTKVGKLYGLIISIKDVICYKGHKVSAGSKMLENYESVYTATALQRLLDEDAIVIGRTNCDEFAMGSANDTSYYGPTINGRGDGLTPGGSSGGAAVSVQQDTCMLALGSDTGGSVRQPAAFCGVHGFKPSYGSISRYGLIAYASSFDVIGLLSKDMDCIETAYMIMGGSDPKDGTSIDVESFDRVIKPSIAYITEAIDHEGIDDSIRKATIDIIEKLKKQELQVEDVNVNLLEYLVPTYYVLTTAEASSNLSRYDGVRYGHRSVARDTLDDMYELSRTEGFGREVKRRIMLGTFVLSAGSYEKFYMKAQKVRRLVLKNLEEILSRYDFIVMPATPVQPWKIGKYDEDPVQMYLSDVYTVLANLTGIPAIYIHTGYSDDGKPIGIQLMTAKGKDKLLFSMAKSVSQLA